MSHRAAIISTSQGVKNEMRRDVVIIGAGPVGLTAALLLSRMGMTSVVVERLLKPTEHPQAHFINMRSMEIFNQISSDMVQKIRESSPPIEQWNKFIYTSHMKGEVLAKVNHFKPGE